MTELTVQKSELRIRQKRYTNGTSPMWQVISVTLYSDGTVKRTVLCERDSQEAALAVIQRNYSSSMSNNLTTERIKDDFIVGYLNLVAEQLDIIARGFNQEGDEERYAWIKVQLERDRKVIDAEHERREKDNRRESLS